MAQTGLTSARRELEHDADPESKLFGQQVNDSSCPSGGRPMNVANPDFHSRPLVIYVDPSQTMLFLRTLLLESEGFEVIGTAWTASARELIEARPPALVLVDVFEPKDELTKFLKEVKRDHRDVTVVVLSQDKSLESPELADCVVSPQAPLESLLSTLHSLLEKGRN